LFIGKDINETVKLARDAFESIGIDSPWLDAEILLADSLNLTREEILVKGNHPFPSEDSKKWQNIVLRRMKREPVDRILGKKRFRKLDFNVVPGVFSPRPETEELLSRALERIPENGCFLDLCCGTGCIGISIANERNCKGVLCDIDTKAVSHAQSEAERLLPNADLTIVQSDLFENIEDKFDLIVSNPPYISTKEKKSLPPEVINFDPEGSLFCGPDGLRMCKSIIDKAPNYLNKNGWLLIEYGFCQKDNVSNLFSSDWTNVKQRKPWGAPRSEKDFFVEAQWSPS
tara:strand:+ start:1955 stop:2815 length:861 start_codon:yes stop_codon:yes gene_type:complete